MELPVNKHGALTVLQRADYDYEYFSKKRNKYCGTPLFECVCNHCGKRVDLTRRAATVMQSCGYTCPQYSQLVRKRSNAILFEGRTITEHAKECGLHKVTLYSRLKNGMPLEEAKRLPAQERGKYKRTPEINEKIRQTKRGGKQ